MVEYGRFNTDMTALTKRIEAHVRYGSHDFNQWVFKHLTLVEGLSILDLGCGTGKQTLPLAQIVGAAGNVVAIDISEEALDAVSESAKDLGIEKRISLLHYGLDDLGAHLHGQVFDRILGCYSLYYAHHPRSVFEFVHRVLKTGGVFFFCGPSKDNNVELKQFHYALCAEQVPPGGGAAVDFMGSIGQQLAQELFTKVEVFTFQNPLRFDSAEALYGYWSSYNLYDERLADKFKAAAERHFVTHAVFETIKRVVGVRTIK